jgi:YHS domain-containing protein
MKSAFSVLAIVMLLGAGCASMQHQQPTTAVATGAPINAYCAVNPHDKVDPQYFTIYEGRKIGFCCPDCKAAFEKEPAKYMAALR